MGVLLICFEVCFKIRACSNKCVISFSMFINSFIHSSISAFMHAFYHYRIQTFLSYLLHILLREKRFINFYTEFHVFENYNGFVSRFICRDHFHARGYFSVVHLFYF